MGTGVRTLGALQDGQSCGQMGKLRLCTWPRCWPGLGRLAVCRETPEQIWTWGPPAVCQWSTPQRGCAGRLCSLAPWPWVWGSRQGPALPTAPPPH